MRRLLILITTALILTLIGCDQAATKPPSPGDVHELVAAEAVIDAFYSWDPAELKAALSVAAKVAPDQVDRTLYYQAWAQAGNYAIQTRRPCEYMPDDVIACAITVTDDIGGALGYVATDTFLLTVLEHQIVGIDSTADDPLVLQEVFDWVVETRPEVMSGPCKDLFAGGTTPAKCVREVVRAAQDYMAVTK